MNLLQMSLSGAVMILVIAVIRTVAINRLPKKTFLVLWGIVMVRLLIPYSLQSAFSIYSLRSRFLPAAEAARDMSDVPFVPVIPVHNGTPMPGSSAVHGAAASADPWVVVWMIGTLMCISFFVTAYLKCRRKFKESLPVDNEYAKLWLSKHGIYRNIEIRQSDRILAPLTYGVFYPVILVPKTTDWDDSDTLKYVFAHEYVHIRRFDAVTKLVLTVSLCIHWFNPAVWIMYVLANRDIELSCDEDVIRQFGEHTKTEYAMSLVHMEETQSGLIPLYNNFSKNAIEERIIAIMKIKKSSRAALIVAAALVIGVTATLATSAKTGEMHENVLFRLSVGLVDAEPEIYEGDAVASDFSAYESYGLMWDESEKALFWNGQRVRYFIDGVDLDGMGAMAIRFEYLDAELDGEIDVHTVRQRVQNADGSFDPMGPLTGLEKYSQAEYDVRTLQADAALEAETSIIQEITRESEDTQAILQAYIPFGLSYEIDSVTGALRMSWREKPVHSIYDAVQAVWIANSMRGLYLGPDAVDLEAVYERGRLTGLRETHSHATTEITFVADGDATEPGTSFSERFEKYASFGITFEEAKGAGGIGNVYCEGLLVSRFIDLTPNGGAFTFTSAEQGDITVKTVYDNRGRLIGVEEIR